MGGPELYEIEFACELEAPPGRVFSALTAEIGRWWDHRFREGSTVGFEPRIGGRFYEDWGGGSAALYATVTFIDPPRRLRLEGPMGMDGAVLGVMEFRLEPLPAGTRLSLAHSILGSLEAATAEEYRAGWAELLGTTLPAYLAKGGAA